MRSSRRRSPQRSRQVSPPHAPQPNLPIDHCHLSRVSLLPPPTPPDEQTAPPLAIVPISGLRGKGLGMLNSAINRAIASMDDE